MNMSPIWMKAVYGNYSLSESNIKWSEDSLTEVNYDTYLQIIS